MGRLQRRKIKGVNFRRDNLIKQIKMNKQKKTNLFVTITVIIIVTVSLSSLGYFPKKKVVPVEMIKDTTDLKRVFKCKNWK